MPVGALSLGSRQLLSIARGLLDDSLTVLFLDEPAASLGQDDADRLHSLIVGLAENGTAVVYVSHRLRDIASVCSRYLVLRDGRLVSDRPMGDLTAKGLAATLTGSEGSYGYPAARQVAEPTAIELKSDNGIEVRRGEILGLFGMAGAEQFQFLKDLYGIGHQTAKVSWRGRELEVRKPEDAIRRGIHMVQADRERDSLVGTMDAISNFMLPWYRRRTGFQRFNKNEIQQVYGRARRELSIKGPPGLAPIGAFSGGNRQKHVLARWMVPVEPKLLLLAQPTQGIDETSKREVREALWRLSDSGITIVVASAESDEIAELCDRSYVVVGGRFIEVLRSATFEEDLLMTLLTTSPKKGVER
jgi:ABC-type sugar transport system ATPase subunit